MTNTGDASVLGSEIFASGAFRQGLEHGFSLRTGGVSPPPYDSLNVGGKWGDDPGHVAENRARLHARAGAPIHLVKQVHGSVVATVGPGDSLLETSRVEADALVTEHAGVAVGVLVADCVPLLMAEPSSGAVAAVHAGWRGTACGVTQAAVEALCEISGQAAKDLHVAIGPSIGPCCFEVGADVAEVFGAQFPDSHAPNGGDRIVRRSGPRFHVDLWRAQEILLARCGVPVRQIKTLGRCTVCDRDRFFSYRRDGRRTGQHLAFIRSPGPQAEL